MGDKHIVGDNIAEQLMPRLVGIAAVTVAICSSGVVQAEPAAASIDRSIRIPVHVTSAAEDRMARRLASALMVALKSDPRFVLAERREPGSLEISLPNRVGWERRLDWTQIIYQARLTSAKGVSRVITGRCWNWNLPVCAKQITDAADQFGSN